MTSFIPDVHRLPEQMKMSENGRNCAFRPSTEATDNEVESKKRKTTKSDPKKGVWKKKTTAATVGD
ncbi:hypothetical protein J6590_102981, partial [Homalodisca vitripennis]